uniref:Precursor peptide for JBIR-140 n=1 Tax=Streptomyces olivoviridis TaxID=67338 RepID=T2HUM0_9ACTN|nr:thioviridamide precursor peptide [Streptomyces olivoviridis]BBI93400.1 precursor peptide for JBIR-140 [Streptomyces olivoviridis]BBI93430.1 precursor peotide for JBIR-140 [synthetic construct]
MTEKTQITDVQAFEDLVAKVQEMDGPAQASSTVAALAGLDAAELQNFLEEKSGISPDEEAQGSVMAAAASIALHC